MELARWRRRYSHLLRNIAIPEPFDLQVFCANIERSRGRPLRLHQLPVEAAIGFCGLYVELSRADHVFFPAGTSAWHQQHIVLHELTHLLCRHRGRGTGRPLVSAGVLHELMPSLDPEIVRTALGRSGYSDPEEREAEMVASLILERAGRVVGPASSDPLGARIESTFG